MAEAEERHAGRWEKKLAGLGATKSLITTRSWWASGMEMTVVGAMEAAVTCGLGRAFGAL